MRLVFCCILSALLFSACYVPNQTVRSSRPGAMPNKPGACYAKCLMPDLTKETVVAELPVYTGDELNPDFEVDLVSIVTQPASTKWTKKKTDNCLSANPDDCLVWCLVEVPEKVDMYKIVVDTTATDQWEMEYLTETILLKSGGYTEWVEVICDNKRSSDLISNIQSNLIVQGYYTGDVSGAFNTETKDALIQFQKNNQLPIGQMDVLSLEALGVSY